MRGVLPGAGWIGLGGMILGCRGVAVPHGLVVSAPDWAGTGPLSCVGGLDEPLVLLHEGQRRAEGLGQVTVDARGVGPGAWTCRAPERSAEAIVSVEAFGGNVLLVILDDVGIDNVAAYGVSDDAPSLPTIDGLLADGIRFQEAWAMPSCSPTRAALMTGRHASRTGIGSVLDVWGRVALPDEEVTLAELLSSAPVPYTSALAGKWHLAPYGEEWRAHPAQQGFAHHAGSRHNLISYFAWDKVTDGQVHLSTTYATTDTTDDALAYVQTLPEPWFVVLSYNAPHNPWHTPPAHLRQGSPDSTAAAYDAALVALDTELGRMLDGMDPKLRDQTTVILLADNGTPEQALSHGVDPLQAKTSWLEGGARVPMLIAGPLVAQPGGVCDAPVHVVDVLPTVAALAGAPLDDGIERDGLSLLPYLVDPAAPPARSLWFTEHFFPNGHGPHEDGFRALRDRAHRLVRRGDGDRVYRRLGPLEELELVPPLDAAAEEALQRLSAAMDEQERVLGIR